MKRKFRTYKEKLLKDLQDSKLALAYLNTALEDEDPRVFLLALKNIIEARGESMTDIAEKTNLNRENLYRMLSRRGNPKLTSIIPVLNTLGLHLTIQYDNRK